MSSLLQFRGRAASGRVHLEFTHCIDKGRPVKGDMQWGFTSYTDVICLPGGKWLPRIWTAPRKPCGMFGPWVVFRYNGEKHVPDLSCPIAVDRLPRDARPLPIADCIQSWSK